MGEDEKLNTKSDVLAKGAFAEELRRRGFSDVRVTRAPADITALMNGDIYYFEIKYTSAEKNYWGAATLSEWEAALELEERYKFVVAYIHQSEWQFHEYTPEEFMQFSSVPPFKIFFRMPIRGGKATPSGRASRAVKFTRERFQEMVTLYKKFRG